MRSSLFLLYIDIHMQGAIRISGADFSLKVTLPLKWSSSLVCKVLFPFRNYVCGIARGERNCAYVCFSLQIINTE